MGADRVDVLESRVTGALRGCPDNPITEAGLQSEWKRHGRRSRVGQHRTDLKHQPLDLLLTTAPWLVAGVFAYSVYRSVTDGDPGQSRRHALNAAGPL